ncbi:MULTISPECIES: sulfurtransferase complex subunit TusD [Thiothrix]|jgi:tRNA 2-thiouridine synthesizing protein D|uniref:Sulfurtransferase complex subunit TusD n=3 Tax=Thiothrix TaxID=1030 RepID=A0A975FAK9_9GAMM|nr:MULTISPECIES: sulfurtransferase complex subunit TusD [Thiothrix]MBO0613573.1 sulfurtransferase complex subunit TusD [Thiothrix fructosivorans]MDQ5769414.1 sulfurtransferase complex subunit TusD [Thiothrix subterranea]MDX9989757.1 sulfurtransferase complex subunit TusD [Thiothrix unzii]QQZ27928.1 sulfurtransferase complex subunit TusD [Thiothrix subterranea]QTR54039.1 sulfurtransferase complex subunit TusD [Thiothrix unzii]
MKYTIMVNEGPYQHQSADTALQFTRAALEKGHEIFRVFFYHDGVNNGTRLSVPPADDRLIQKSWSELAEKHGLDLVICIAAAQRRGLMDADEAKRQGLDANNIAPGFRISGLGQLVEGGIQSDRLVVFGD